MLVLSVCFVGSLQNPHLINLNLSTANYPDVFMVGRWVCLEGLLARGDVLALPGGGGGGDR